MPLDYNKIKELLLKSKDKFAKEKYSFGLDIGTAAIKMVKLKFIKDAVEFCDLEIEPSQDKIEDVLKKIRQSQGQPDTVNIGVCGPATVTRYVNFPQMDKKEFKQALKFEAQKHIPFSVEEVNTDGYILKEGLPDNKILVLIAAVKKETINQRLKLVEEAGFRANIIDIDSIALVNAFNFSYPADDNLRHKAVALLNIGSSMSNLNILEDGVPRLSRDIHVAGNNFTQKLMEIKATDFASAEKLKLNPDKESTNKLMVVLESVLTNLSSEIRTSFDYYESQSASSVVRIFLSGGGSKFIGLKDALANLLGIEVEYWDPLKGIKIAENVDVEKLKNLSADLAVAVGLALRQ